MVRNFILYTIISGLVVNLLANMIWKYLPETSKPLDLIITAILIMVCILILLIPHIKKWGQKDTSIFLRYNDKIAIALFILACIIMAFYAYHEQKQFDNQAIGERVYSIQQNIHYLDINGNGQPDPGEPYWVLHPPNEPSAMPPK